MSFPPPSRELLTISDPRRIATLVRAPGATSPAIENARRSTWRGCSSPSKIVGWDDSVIVSCAT